MLDPLSIAIEETRANDQGYVWYAVDPNEMYPETMEHILGVLSSAEPRNQVTTNLLQYTFRAMALSAAEPSAWGWALQPRASFTDARMIGMRAEALEIARLWFTEMLHAANNVPIGVHILKDERWKL